MKVKGLKELIAQVDEDTEVVIRSILDDSYYPIQTVMKSSSIFTKDGKAVKGKYISLYQGYSY